MGSNERGSGPESESRSESEFVPDTADLLYERRGPVAILTFNRPGARNAMTREMYEGLFQACEHVDNDDRVRVLVLRGAGDKAFVSGSEISQFLAFTRPEDPLDYERRSNHYFDRLEAVSKPTIAMLRGACAGGGVMIALSCDLRLAATNVRVGVPIANTLGNTLSTRNLARIVAALGVGRTLELIYTARFIEAAEGAGIGLFNEVVDGARLEERTMDLAQSIAAKAPLTLRTIKQGVRRVVAGGPYDGPWEDARILAAYLSDDFREGVAAFLEKRTPGWQGR